MHFKLTGLGFCGAVGFDVLFTACNCNVPSLELKKEEYKYSIKQTKLLTLIPFLDMEFIEVEAWFGNRSFYLHPSVKREEVLKIQAHFGINSSICRKKLY